MRYELVLTRPGRGMRLTYSLFSEAFLVARNYRAAGWTVTGPYRAKEAT